MFVKCADRYVNLNQVRQATYNPEVGTVRLSFGRGHVVDLEGAEAEDCLRQLDVASNYACVLSSVESIAETKDEDPEASGQPAENRTPDDSQAEPTEETGVEESAESEFPASEQPA